MNNHSMHNLDNPTAATSSVTRLAGRREVAAIGLVGVMPRALQYKNLELDKEFDYFRGLEI